LKKCITKNPSERVKKQKMNLLPRREKRTTVDDEFEDA
jgi:hypothetical protein